MSEQVSWNSIFTIIGVIVGFSLSQFTELLKNRRRKGVIRKALHNELSVAYDSIVKARDNTSTLVLENSPLVTDTYDTEGVDLASMLIPKKLLTVQRAYQHIKQLNKPKSADAPRGYLAYPDGKRQYQHDLGEDVRVLEEAISVLRD